MKKIFYSILFCLAAVSFNSCKIDNYEEPKETLKGKVVDKATGELVLTDQGSEGTRIRLRELSWTETKEPNNFDFFCMKEGIYQNTKLFKGHYNVRIDGAFMPLLRKDNSGDTIEDATKYVDIKGVTVVDWEVEPFLRVEWVGEPTVNAGKITATIKVTRAISEADFKARIQPMGGYSDDFFRIDDVRLFVSQVPYVGYRSWDSRYTRILSYGDRAFDAKLGQPLTLETQGVIPAGRTVFIRGAARINYRTEGQLRHNYNEAIRIDIPR